MNQKQEQIIVKKQNFLFSKFKNIKIEYKNLENKYVITIYKPKLRPKWIVELSQYKMNSIPQKEFEMFFEQLTKTVKK